MMGFPELRSKKALLATGNSDPEAAMEWLFAHMEDAGAYSSFGCVNSCPDCPPCAQISMRHCKLPLPQDQEVHPSPP
jgi:ubiquitin carboxyl-terminal hydrolase 5/13